MTDVTCRLTTKNRDQLQDPRLGNRVWASFTFFYLSGATTATTTTSVDDVLNKKRFQNIINQQQHTHTRLTAFVRDYLGDPVPEK